MPSILEDSDNEEEIKENTINKSNTIADEQSALMTGQTLLENEFDSIDNSI